MLSGLTFGEFLFFFVFSQALEVLRNKGEGRDAG